MKKFITLLITVALTCLWVGDAFAKRRPHVVIHKRPAYLSERPPPGLKPPQRPPLTPVGGIAFVPGIAMLYDLQRRTSCAVPADYLGLGGPGFDRPVTPKEGNVMIPAWQRGACGRVVSRPK